MRLIKWLFRDAFLAEYNAGYRDGTAAILLAIQRTKTVIAGAAPIAGLQAFLTKEVPNEVSIVECRFETRP